MNDTRLAAKRELARRKLARERFLDFERYVYKGYPWWARHLRLLASYLEDVERYVATEGAEGIGRLMVFMPPRHWKSTTTSVLFPAWVLGKNPDLRIGITSYNAALAKGFSRRGRNHLMEDSYRALFGDRAASEVDVVEVSDDTRSVEEWNVAGTRGGVAATGVGGGLTGRGFNLLIVDDPHKDRADAESVTRRELVWSWWTSTARTRIEKGGAVIVIQTRWHSEDLSGKLIKQMIEDPEADQWTILCLPALAEEWAQAVEAMEVERALKDGWFMGVDPLDRQPGEVLCERMFDMDYFRPIRANSGYDWDALYQQRPRKLEGKLIKAHQIKIIDADQVPGEVRPVRYWDLAVGRSKRADWICGALVGRDKQKNFYIMDIMRIPAPWSAARPKMVRAMRDDPVEVVQGIEVAGQQDGYYQEFRDDDALQGVSIVPVAPKGDKEARAQLWATRIEDGKVFMVRGPWNDDFVAEALSFPGGRNDDQVDAVSGGWQMLPGYVSMEDLPQARDVPSKWDMFNEVGARHSLEMDTGKDVLWGMR